MRTIGLAPCGKEIWQRKALLIFICIGLDQPDIITAGPEGLCLACDDIPAIARLLDRPAPIKPADDIFIVLALQGCTIFKLVSLAKKYWPFPAELCLSKFPG